mgnify:CR=1 FL=1
MEKNKKIKKVTNVQRTGIMLVVSSPSGAGKTTLANKLLEEDKDIELSISVTTRKKRKEEKNKKDYIFIDESDFNKMVKYDELLEYALVFGNKYGTPKEPIYEKLKRGKDILFDIDWQGTQALKEKELKKIVSVFILPPSKKDLEKRLISRGQDSDKEVKKRMAEANSEITHWPEYDYVIVNDDIKETLKKLKSILNAERLKRNRQTGLTDFVRKITN